MSATPFNLTLINLSLDARMVMPGERIERRQVPASDLRVLLQAMQEIDAMETATTDPEIRVYAPQGTYVVRVLRNNLVLSDASNGASSGHVLSVDQIMAEIDGRAAAHVAARYEAPLAADGLAATDIYVPGADPTAPRIPVEPPPDPRSNASPRRVAILATMAVLLLAAGLFLRGAGSATPERVAALKGAEADAAWANLVGVYLVGTGPGQHGIVVNESRRLQLLELRAKEAPRLVYASARLGRHGGQLALATDQPGGLITIQDADTLMYGQEVFRRVR